MQRVVIIDYGSGNLHSAAKAFERAAREGEHAAEIIVSGHVDDVQRADRVVLPGVGAFRDCRRGLDAVDGLVGALQETVIAKARPFLGICVGMQLMAERGLEHAETPGLGWIGGDVAEIAPADPALKVPHMGWNTLDVDRSHAVLADVPTGDDGWHAYFVHSYHLAAATPACRIAMSSYGGAITAIVGRDNLVGTQFHPEKSQALGLALISNFLRWAP
ncbi:MAG: imidazole glycerol phosphate synthase subunit HisH [Pseudomonadota bacterium]